MKVSAFTSLIVRENFFNRVVSNMFDFKDKIVVVTGGARGIGNAYVSNLKKPVQRLILGGN